METFEKQLVNTHTIEQEAIKLAEKYNYVTIISTMMAQSSIEQDDPGMRFSLREENLQQNFMSVLHYRVAEVSEVAVSWGRNGDIHI